jgi:murein L,D-transpeptidase YafK
MSVAAALLAIGAALWAEVAPRPYPVLDGPVDRILVFKADREMFLMRDGRPIRMYPISLGWEPEGDKQRQGDGRTPEGVFLIDRRNDQSRFHLSVGLDYPQPEDVERAAKRGWSPGGDIFIHGQPEGVEGAWRIPTDWTAGCIALANVHMDEVWEVTPMGTVVEVLP